MRQVTQRLKDGRVEVVEVPPPELTPDTVLVDVRASVLSAGTERTKVATGRANLVAKARARPEEVRKVIEKARRDGVRETIQAVRLRLDERAALGYSAAGVVVAVGERVVGLAPGDHVACGGEHAAHAEIDRVPANLCVRLPGSVTFAEGAFATIGSVALHAVRQADVRLGERVAVIGVGLVGQLAGHLLRAAGCFVVGVDTVGELVEHAAATGAVNRGYRRADVDPIPEDAVACDAVLVTAATRSADPLRLAGELARDRGRIVVVGDVGTEFPRRVYYEKELELRLSRSYGPGRYDRLYEEHGVDYPIGYVRWTERRNMAAFVDLIAAGKIDVGSLVSERVPLEQAPEAYERLVSGERSPLGVVLEYAPSSLDEPQESAVPPRGKASSLAVGVLGAGSFATRVLIPGLEAARFPLQAIASSSGLSARSAAERFGFQRSLTPREVISDDGVSVVAIATRHASHARLTAAALDAGKHVFVEKPPCLTSDELADLRSARERSGLLLMVGYNRRHAVLAQELKSHVAGRGFPLEIVYRVNAGTLPPEHWLNDPDEGGGRLLGEGCHFIDFCCWLVDAPVRTVACSLRAPVDEALASAQAFSVQLDFGDGSLATILYGAGGAPTLGKEYVEAHAGGRSAVLDDFRSLKLVTPKGTDKRRSRGGDKGHGRQFLELRRALETGSALPGPDPLDSMAATLAALVAGETGCAVRPAG